MNINNVITVAERLYYEANPNTKSDVPSFAYEQVQAANKRRCEAQSELDLYEWCQKEFIYGTEIIHGIEEYSKIQSFIRKLKNIKS